VPLKAEVLGFRRYMKRTLVFYVIVELLLLDTTIFSLFSAII
jgi:hypothetical protein